MHSGNRGVRCILASIVLSLSLSAINCSNPEKKQDNKGWQAPASADSKKMPFDNLAVAAQKGKELYQLYCWSCHGESGFGDGAAGSALGQQPANFHSNRVKRQSDGALFWKLSTGLGNMPGFAASLTEEQRWQLIAYVRRIGDEERVIKPPVAKAENLEISQLMEVGGEAVRILYHAATNQLYYTTFNGDVFKIRERNGGKPDSVKILSVKDHGITRLQGAAFYNNYLFLSGNVDQDNKKGTNGRMVKYLLNAADTTGTVDSSKIKVVFTTVVYGANKTIYDHGWNALEISPDGKFIFVNSGARTDHGEVQDNGGSYPNARDNALTSKIFRFPIDAENLFLEDDINKLKAAGYIYAEGIRNAYDMAFDKNNQLFAVVNSSDYDNPEDMFWVREGHHYGFPWIMGGIENPQQFPGWKPDPETDQFINPSAHSWQVRYFKDDSTFPKRPDSLKFTPGVQNYGPAANEYRGHSGKIMDGDITGLPVSTFTAHSSPLGLFFDTKNKLPGDFKGDGFVIRYEYGPRSVLMRTFNTGGGDLLHLSMVYNKETDNYVMHAKTILDGLAEPTDAVLVNDTVYIITYGGKKGFIWKIRFLNGS